MKRKRLRLRKWAKIVINILIIILFILLINITINTTKEKAKRCDIEKGHTCSIYELNK